MRFYTSFCDNDQPKNYITQELQSNIVKSMVMILRNCENMEDLNDMLKKQNPNSAIRKTWTILHYLLLVFIPCVNI